MTAHQLAGARMELPEDWERLPSPDDQRLVALEPETTPEAGFRANLVLTAVANGGISFRDWQAGTDKLLPQQLTMYQLLDLEKRDVGGHPGGRRLAAHVVNEMTPVTMEQWFALVDDVGYTLTATVDSWRYDELADFFAEIAESLVLPTGSRAPTQQEGAR